MQKELLDFRLRILVLMILCGGCCRQSDLYRYAVDDVTPREIKTRSPFYEDSRGWVYETTLTTKRGVMSGISAIRYKASDYHYALVTKTGKTIWNVIWNDHELVVVQILPDLDKKYVHDQICRILEMLIWPSSADDESYFYQLDENGRCLTLIGRGRSCNPKSLVTIENDEFCVPDRLQIMHKSLINMDILMERMIAEKE